LKIQPSFSSHKSILLKSHTYDEKMKKNEQENETNPRKNKKPKMIPYHT
jgi:hypothetical protein